MAPSRAEDSESCCGLGFVKYVMYFFTVITIVCGWLFLAVAADSYFLKSEIIHLLHSEVYLYIIYLMAGIGILIVCNSCLVCGTANNKCVISVYTLVLLVILALEVSLCYFVLTHSMQVEKRISQSFIDDVAHKYEVDVQIRKAVDRIQIEGQCCGAHGFDDYVKESSMEELEDDIRSKKQYVPDSCCKSPKLGCGINDHPSNIHYSGCESFLQDIARQQMYYISTISVAAAIIQMFAVMFVCCFCIRSPTRSHEPLHKRADHEMSLLD